MNPKTNPSPRYFAVASLLMSLPNWKSQYRVIAIMAIAGISIGLGAVSVTSQLSGTATSTVILSTKASKIWGPIWSAIMRAVLTFSRHAVVKATAARLTPATIKNIVNNGRVVNASNGVTRIRRGNIDVLINTSTGNIITIIKRTGGGSGGGGV